MTIIESYYTLKGIDVAQYVAARLTVDNIECVIIPGSEIYDKTTIRVKHCSTLNVENLIHQHSTTFKNTHLIAHEKAVAKKRGPYKRRAKKKRSAR